MQKRTSSSLLISSSSICRIAFAKSPTVPSSDKHMLYTNKHVYTYTYFNVLIDAYICVCTGSYKTHLLQPPHLFSLNVSRSLSQ